MFEIVRIVIIGTQLFYELKYTLKIKHKKLMAYKFHILLLNIV